MQVTVFGKELVRAWTECICINSTATLEVTHTHEHEIVHVVGNQTEGALLMLSRNLGVEYSLIRRRLGRLNFHTFTSARKRMSCVVPNFDSNGLRTSAKRLYVKGAAEIVLGLCIKILNNDGLTTRPLTADDRTRINEDIVRNMATEGLRTICLAYRVLDDATVGLDLNDSESIERELTCLGMVGMLDPLRPDAKEAVLKCRRAGITMRMVSGDNLGTAIATAKEAGMFDDKMGDLALEGPEFRRRVTDAEGKIYKPEFDAIWPRLRVLARCSAEDKLTLVRGLQEEGQTVIMTGDSTTDAPALEAASVGLAMGIAGTDVAKSMSDIIVMDDSFATIAKVVMWGRHGQDAVGRTIQYQLTATAVATLVALVGALVLKESPFSPAQLLWINRPGHPRAFRRP
jgi:Ca2+ transporting ATPase